MLLYLKKNLKRKKQIKRGQKWRIKLILQID